jgi:cyclase
MIKVLEATGVLPEDVCLVINTHNHADHINGNPLFHCPVICHKRAKAYLGKKCAKLGQELITFDEVHKIDLGSVHLKLIHTGGHTPESFIVWLPEDRVLFPSDLIFSGRMPYLASVTNFNILVKALKWLPSLGAEVIVPGHGPLCDEGEIRAQIHYLETTWEIIKQHVEDGHTLSMIRSDPTLPEMPGRNYERNIEWIYKRLKKKRKG